MSRIRLRQFLFAAFGTIAVLLGLCLVAQLLRPSIWNIALAAVLAFNALIDIGVLRLVERGALAFAVTVISIELWVSAMVASYLSPFTLPIHVVAAILPAIFVVPYVDRRRLPGFSIVTIASIVVCGVLAAPLLSSVPRSPGISAAAIVGLPVMSTLILLVVWHTATTLQDIATAARRSADALALSQQLLARRAEQLAASRARLVAAIDAERRRLERDLHDGAQQDLVAVAVTVQLARQLVGSNDDECARMLTEASDLLQTAIGEIRRLAHGIYPTLLASGGLRAALAGVTHRSAVPVLLNIADLGRYRSEIETALYFCCLEALQNTAKHGGNGVTATISAHQEDGTLTITVSDNGCGFEPSEKPAGVGLTNMQDRLAVIGGALIVASTPGQGTRVTATVPAQPIPGHPRIDDEEVSRLSR
ncbi:sensor histidine kinase [Nocardia sp. NPDC056100]|uniref:sensor histidine kinase n=1 Tax=Nocardia sp. NPDC056100 TaxID=3345712 RepID=UPI0035D5B156